jgi:hypothetical protein
MRFRVGDDAVHDLAACLTGWLDAPASVRDRTRRALAQAARDRFSWDGVARTVVAAAEGRLNDLPRLDGSLARAGARTGGYLA